MNPPTHHALDQPGPLQHLDMLGRPCQRYRIRLGQLADTVFTIGQLPQHRAPRGVGQRMEQRIQLGFILNHRVSLPPQHPTVNRLVE